LTLIKSISGIRGTIGGKPGESLSPIDVVKFSAAYGTWMKQQSDSALVVIGRDARPTGGYIADLVSGTLRTLGIDVVDLGLSTTPTVEVEVVRKKAGGGIIITASHNPNQWNALKLLNDKGEFISAADGAAILDIAESDDFEFVDVKQIGSYAQDDQALSKHIEDILALPLVDREAIRNREFHVIVDGVNSSGGIAVPLLLEKLGVKVEKMFCEPNGQFPHNPEPLPENIRQICSELQGGNKFDLGIIVDPDVDRLALVTEDGMPFGEEYTLVAVSDYVLTNTPGNTVSNLSSTRALRDVTEKHKCTYNAAAVGEVNVVVKMKETNAVIGGEGNGGVIYPELHYGRDALVGIALFLSHLAKSKMSASRLRAKYPNYYISKNKIELTPEIDVDAVLIKMKDKYSNNPVNTIDGVKIEFDKEWVHLRKSNTEPIIRIYSESANEATSEHLANKIIMDIKDIISEDRNNS